MTSESRVEKCVEQGLRRPWVQWLWVLLVGPEVPGEGRENGSCHSSEFLEADWIQQATESEGHANYSHLFLARCGVTKTLKDHKGDHWEECRKTMVKVTQFSPFRGICLKVNACKRLKDSSHKSLFSCWRQLLPFCQLPNWALKN